MSAPPGLRHLPTIMERLNQAYPDARYELNWENPLQLLVATILAAQCTDERVNRVTPALFARYPDARAFAEADTAELEELIRPTGFFHNKAKEIQGACRGLAERFGGEVPASMEEMLTLPGVARKTANVVLNNAFRVPSGVIVDSHVARVSQRLGLTDQTKPERIEEDLMRAVPQGEWIQFGPALVLHGRYVCTAHAPRCPACIMNDVCPKRGVEETSDEAPAPRPSAAGSDARVEAKPPAAARGRAGTVTEQPDEDDTSDARGPEDAMASIPSGWRKVLAGEVKKPYFRELQEFVAAERENYTVYPPEKDVFNALKYTPYDEVRVVLLGQDPYHDEGQAHGLAFSVRPGVRPPPSLVNIFKELRDDLGCRVPNNGYLVPWAERGVLLLNAVLTVRAHQPNSHKDKGWERFTDAVIRAVDEREQPAVFLLWGAYAQKKQKIITTAKHPVVTGAHPSPLSAKKFFGSKPFSAVNGALEGMGSEPIDWQIPDIEA